MFAPAEPAAGSPPSRRRHFDPKAGWVCIFLFVAVAGLHAQGVRHQFASIDDDDYIVRNPAVRAGLKLRSVGWAFTTLHDANWHPLTWLSHMADVELFGLYAGGHHAVSALLHAANAVLLFTALRRMTRRMWPSALAAALFAVHPLHVESVAWVAERKEVLAGTLWMLALVAYARYAERPSIRRYVAVFACMALGLLAKPTLVTLPFALLLLDFWPLGRVNLSGESLRKVGRGLLAEKLPLLGLSAASSAVTLVAQRMGGSLSDLERLSLIRRTANAAVAYVAYLLCAVWPAKLAVFYPYPPAPEHSSISIRFGVPLAAGLFLALATSSALRFRKCFPYLLVGWLWFLGVLVPVIGIVQAGMQSRADRYTYLPLIGIYVALAWAVADWIAGLPRNRSAAVSAAGLALAVLAGTAWIQIGYWKNARTLYEHALRVTQDNFIAHHGLGFEFEKEGDFVAAAAQFTEALRINGSFARSHNSLGAIYARQGDSARAAAEFQRAMESAPRSPEAFFNAGLLREGLGDLVGAAAYYERAVLLAPPSAEALNNLGRNRERRGDLPGAVSSYEAALGVNPDLPEAHFNLARVSAAQGDTASAARHLEAYLLLRPDDVRARTLLESMR